MIPKFTHKPLIKGFKQVGKRFFMGLPTRRTSAIPGIRSRSRLWKNWSISGPTCGVYDPFVPSLATKAGMFASVGSVEEALSGAECAVFIVDHNVFRGISVETVKGLMASPVVVDGKNLFVGGEGIAYLGFGKASGNYVP